MKKRRRGRSHKHYAGTGGGDVVELAARLAPLEEHHAQAAEPPLKADGSILLDTGKLRLPKEMMEAEREKRGPLGLEPAVIVILLLMLAFIAVIAYLVYRMPSPAQ